MPQHKDKDTTKNKYQIGIIIAIALMMIYGYSLFNSVRMHKTSSIYFNGAVMALWFLLALYWLRQLGRHYKNKEGQEKKD